LNDFVAGNKTHRKSQKNIPINRNIVLGTCTRTRTCTRILGTCVISAN